MKQFILLFIIFWTSLVNATLNQDSEITTKFKFSSSAATDARFLPLKPQLFSSNQKNPNSVTSSGSSEGIEVSPYGDSYSLAPLIENSEYAYYMTPSGQATTHNFDGAWETIGDNQYGTAGGKILVIEETRDLENGDIQVTVQVTAVDAENNPEPWVDGEFSGSGFTVWRLDVGTTLGGSNPISLSDAYQVVSSGVSLYDSEMEKLVDIDINDTSNSNSLSGQAFAVLEGDADISGYDLATMVMYWNIKVESGPADLAITILDAEDGTYGPEDSVPVTIKVENLGGQTSAPYLITFYASIDTNITPEDAGRYYEMEALGVDENVHQTFHPILPGDVPSGQYYIGGILDIDDANNSNNTRYDPTPITVANVSVTVPDAPTLTSVVPGDGTAVLHFTANGNGGSAITGYTAKCAAFAQAGTSSPITVNGLRNGYSYSCSVVATNAIGNSASSASLSVTPVADSPQSNVSNGYSGAWYNADQDGHGLNVHVLNENSTLIYWYVYHTDGTPMFLITVGENDGNSTTGTTYYHTGMKFGEFDPNDIQQTVWGTSTVTFHDCNNATLEYSADDFAYGSGSISMTKLADVSGLECSDKADLAITILDAGNGTYAAGEILRILNKTENIGGTTSEAYRLTFYASTNTTISTSDYNLGYTNRLALGAGENHYQYNDRSIPESIPAGQYYIGAIVSVDGDSNSSNNTKYDPTPITVSSSSNPTNAVEGRWTGSMTISGGGMSCRWDMVGVADAITSTTGRIAISTTIKYQSASDNGCISDYSEGDYSINGNKVRIEITYMETGIPFGDSIHNFVLDSSNRLIQDESEWYQGVWMTTTSTLVKD